jgi:transcription initiation factor TFIIH subunit 2
VLIVENNNKTNLLNFHLFLGSYGVVLNETHFKDLLFEAIPPPAVTQTRNTSNLVMMGFPTKSNDLHPSYCVWYVTDRTGVA